MDDKIVSLIDTYQPSSEGIAALSKVFIVPIVGISGAGKNTIITELLKSNKYHFIITHTTRAPRTGETNGVSYHFVDRLTALDMMEQKKFIETNYYSQNIYGTSVAEFEKAANDHKVAIADIDVNGVENLMALAPKSVRPVFLVPPSYEVWLQRWQRRYGENYDDHKDDLHRRLRTAMDELNNALEKDYYFFVVNDDIDEAVKAVDAIAQTGTQSDDQREAGKQVTRQILAAMEQA